VPPDARMLQDDKVQMALKWGPASYSYTRARTVFPIMLMLPRSLPLISLLHYCCLLPPPLPETDPVLPRCALWVCVALQPQLQGAQAPLHYARRPSRWRAGGTCSRSTRCPSRSTVEATMERFGETHSRPGQVGGHSRVL